VWAQDRRLALPGLLAPVMRVLAGLAVVLALALAAAGCGSSKSSSGTTTSAAQQKANWADGMCSALATWESSVKSAGSKLSGGNLSKSTINDALTGISDANKKLKDDLDSLGKPPTPSADEARSSLQSLSTDMSQNVDKIKQALSSGNATGAASAASSAAQAMAHDVQQTQTKLQSLSAEGGWQKAFANSASCKKLSG
jgi:hypothetical protein